MPLLLVKSEVGRDRGQGPVLVDVLGLGLPRVMLVLQELPGEALVVMERMLLLL